MAKFALVVVKLALIACLQVEDWSIRDLLAAQAGGAWKYSMCYSEMAYCLEMHYRSAHPASSTGRLWEILLLPSFSLNELFCAWSATQL